MSNHSGFLFDRTFLITNKSLSWVTLEASILGDATYDAFVDVSEFLKRAVTLSLSKGRAQRPLPTCFDRLSRTAFFEMSFHLPPSLTFLRITKRYFAFLKKLYT